VHSPNYFLIYEFCINSAGVVIYAGANKGDGFTEDRAVIAEIVEWTFSPYYLNDAPTPVCAQVLRPPF
jgi:hypothetical protein